MAKKKYVKICPRCYSTDVSPDFSSPAAISAGALYMYRCNRCGFVGPSALFPEVPIDKVPKPKDLKKIKGRYETVNITYGRGITGLWKYLGPIGIFLSIMMYFSYPAPYNILSIIYPLPILLYLTFYGFGKKYFEKYILLRIGLLFMILYAIFGPLLFYILLK